MSLTALTTRNVVAHADARDRAACDPPAAIPVSRAVSSEQLEREIITLPNKALRQAACELITHVSAADHESAASLYRLLYTLERLQVSLAWCDALRAATLLIALPGTESGRHREAQSSLSRELRSCADVVETLCRAIPGSTTASRVEHLRSRILEVAAKLLDRLFCEERMLYPPLISELSPALLYGRAVSAVEQLDARSPLGRQQLLEYLLRAMRAADLPPPGDLLFR